MKNKVFLLLRIVISFLLLFFLLKFVNLGQLITILRKTDKKILLIVVFLNLMIVPLLSYRWQIILASQKFLIKLSELIRLTFIGMFFNNFLPTSAGGDVVKGYYLLKDSDKKIDLGASILFDRIIGTISIIIMALISAILFYRRLPITSIIFIFSLSLIVLSSILFLRNQKLAKRFSRFFRLYKHKTLNLQSKRVYERFHRYLHSQRMLTKSIGVSFIAQIFSILMNYLIIISLGAQIPLFMLFIYIPLIWVFALFPSINGLGIREGSYVYFFKGIIGKETAFALSIVILALIMFNGIIGGLIYLAMGGKIKISREKINKI